MPFRAHLASLILATTEPFPAFESVYLAWFLSCQCFPVCAQQRLYDHPKHTPLLWFAALTQSTLDEPWSTSVQPPVFQHQDGADTRRWPCHCAVFAALSMQRAVVAHQPFAAILVVFHQSAHGTQVKGAASPPNPLLPACIRPAQRRVRALLSRVHAKIASGTAGQIEGRAA